ncbi:MAG TPA: ribonuclease R [Saprospiraceae bacterium]|nr:ribonuclease R [Saprospiraceae bacterium]HMP25933.1 ribonuclease R [Saprospiraceae bacterium]
MSKRKKESQNNKLTTKQLQQEILQMLQKEPRKRYNPRQIAKKLQIDNNKDSILHALEQLVDAGQVSALGDFKFKIKTQLPDEAARNGSNMYEGYVDMTRSGSAYIESENLDDDVFIQAKNLNTALHGDRVLIRAWVPRGRRRAEGEVVKVVERATEYFLGTIRIFEKYAVMTPDQSLALEILIALEDTKDASDGDKVVVRIKTWGEKRGEMLQGRVTTVLGKAGTSDIEMKAILINHGFNLDFTEEVMAEVEQLDDHITEAEIARRLDLREVLTFTIDPFNAKDFDDALSFRRLDNGHLEVGVHIADVSHYVKPGTKLDLEAYKRSTSVYLVDRVLPMLPERLSNELCSLRPHEDKFTFSAIFTFDENDKIVGRWFGKTITHSNRRFVYDEVQEILDKGAGEFHDELKKLNELAHKLRKARFRKGAINFETEEVQFKLDEQGVPIEVFVKERKDAHLLIEDFMLLANREVATFIAEKGKEQEIPFVYRVHDEPNPDKVEALAAFAREMGFVMKVDSPKAISQSYNALAKAAEKNPALQLLEPIAIRTMAKAEYSTNNIGHYGLAFEYYAHFTSPIRRYSDVLAHRILELNLQSDKVYRAEKEPLEERCKHVSMQERKAMDAERESVKYKQVEYMSKHVGEDFPGYIAGILDRGFFVALEETLAEGFVGFETMSEPFEIAENRLRMKGVYSKRELKMGDPVTVRILRTDIDKRQIDMMLTDEIDKAKTERSATSAERPRRRKAPENSKGKTGAATRRHKKKA